MLFGETFNWRRNWPPRPNLLTYPIDYGRGLNFDKQADWSIDEWRNYAKYLEESGESLMNSLEQKLKETETKLTLQRALASRRKTPVKKPKGLLSILDEPRTKRGRPKDVNSKPLEYARLVLQKRAVLEAKGQTVTDAQALEAVCEELNLPRMQKQLVIGRKKTILNKLPQLRQSR